MELTKNRNTYVDFLIIIIGTIILAMAINIFFEPMDIVTGGVTGLAIIVKNCTISTFFKYGVPIWLTNVIVNVPLFLIAVFLKGKNFGIRSLFATFFLSFALYFTQPLANLIDISDIILTSVFGGVIAGIGIGLVLSAFSTTGGTDLAASIIQHYVKHISVAQIMLFIDALIILYGAYIFGAEKALYAILSVYITTKVIDAILEGIHFSKAVIIISNKYEEIADNIFETLDRGVTCLNGKGMYTKVSKQVLLCVVSKKEIIKLKELVRIIDKNAFVIVSDVKEVLGEGFIEYKQ